VPALTVLCSFVIFGRFVLGTVFGDFYRTGALPLAILSIGAMVAVATGSCGMALIMTGHQRTVMKTSLFSGVVTTAGAFAAAGPFGATGVAVVAAAGNITQNMLQLVACRWKLGLRTHVSLVVTAREVRQAWTAYRGR
jgi:O-antigen/teichoic acid export membrane protein